MKINHNKPLFFNYIKHYFPSAKWGEVCFAFGDTVYTKNDLPNHLVVHEETHLKQQNYSNIEAFKWWRRYVKDDEFRLSQEIPAHVNQWNAIKATEKDRNKIYKWKIHLAKAISSPVYNNMITYNEALKLFI